MDIEAKARAELKKKRARVGFLFAGALVMALLLAYWMGAFSVGPTKTVHVDYNFAGGIERGSPVRLGGIRVGRVSDIVFTPTAESWITLELKVSNEAFSQFTSDTKFYINLAGLIGERYVEVVPGDNIAEKGIATHFRGIDPPRVDQLLSQGYGIFGDLRGFFKDNKDDIREIVQSVNGLSKSLSQLAGASSPTQRKSIEKTFSNVADMSGDLKESLARINKALAFMDQSGAKGSWIDLVELLSKANAIQLNDLRKLMMEDGVKVNFSAKKIETLKEEVEREKSDNR